MSDSHSDPSSSGVDANVSLTIPRLYQAELIEEAKKRNIIIRADTGTGKTLVALNLIVWTAAQPKSHPDEHLIQAFLVPTRPLCHQQAQYIQSHSKLRVKAYTGDLQADLRKIDAWRSELNEVDVIVSTAQVAIFYDLISKGYWDFEDVSLLIFDEAHHCRKNHIYNQIMRGHYHRLAQDPTQRLPKILGLTASPIWDYKDLIKAEKEIKNLQSALASQIYEVKRHTEDVSEYNFKPNELAVYFEPPSDFQKLSHPPWEQINELLAMHASVKATSIFESVYMVLCFLSFAPSRIQRATLASNTRQLITGLPYFDQELGTYAYSLSVLDWLKSLLTIGGLNQMMSGHLLDPIHQQRIQGAITQLEQLLMNIEDIPGNQLSSKVIALSKILVNYKEKDHRDDFHCIVFVERRQHAQLLSTLLEHNVQLKDFIRPGTLIGHGGGSVNDSARNKMDSKSQNETVAKFKTGEHNLTIATSVAEEGLDFRSCRVVIRFDQISTWKGYIQSRGRARARDSDYILMLPTGSSNKYDAFGDKEEMLKATLYNRPEDELIESGQVESTPQLVCRLADGKDSVLTYGAAPGILNGVCQLIPPDEFLPDIAPEYEVTCLLDGFQCKVTLPSMAALDPSQRSFTGLIMSTKKDAKRSAAFEACKVLRVLDVLDEHFLPRREDRNGESRDADGREVDTTSLPDQVQAIIPNVYGDWRTSTEVWLHKLSFPDGSPAGFSTIGFLCVQRMCITDGLQLFDHYEGSRPLPIKIEQSQKIAWGQDDLTIKLQKLETFTRLVLQVAVNRKAYEGRLFFLVAPLLKDTCEIDWNLVDSPLIPLSDCASSPRNPCIIVPISQLHCRIFETCEPCGDLFHGSLPQMVPDSASNSEFRKKISKFRNLGHYYAVAYNLKSEQFQGKLVYVQSTFHVMNNLSKSESTIPQPYRVLLPLDICKGTRISRSLWKVFSYLPSLTRLLHDAFQATALFKRMNVPVVSLPLAIEALTPPGVGDRVPWDYQTLETVGDAFLKFATSVHVYLSHLKKGEGDMSYLRAQSIGNAYLRGKAVRANLPGSILNQRFRTDKFRDAQTEEGKELADGNFSTKIPRRVLSDVAEAILGVGYLTGGIESGLKVGTALDLCFGGPTPWNQRELNIRFEKDVHEKLEPSMILKYEHLERKIGYVFKEKLLLVQALTHRSANSFLTNCYEREEWLGDAVIDMWIIEHAYKRFEDVTADELSLTRSKVSSNGSLGFLAIKKLGLHEIIMHKSKSFRIACAEAVEAIKPFMEIAEFFSDINNLFVVFDPPKMLNDVLEAIVGAVFIDSSFDLPTVYRTLDIIFEDVTPGLSRHVSRDPVSVLVRLRDQFQCTELRRTTTIIDELILEGDDKKVVSVKVCRIEFHGQEIAIGRHKSSTSVAEQRASLRALEVLRGDAQPFEKLGPDSLWSKCDCVTLAIAALAMESSSTKSKKNGKKKEAILPTDMVPEAGDKNNKQPSVDVTGEKARQMGGKTGGSPDSTSDPSSKKRKVHL
ncbi:hypothetical protein Pst134EA_011373 [Puccinia striiformis f. sp. tritici]|uniref:hypothetical protein n=1 Tax=Puccinia striiformis f. sp. tritici TaxID=168172 RepID=UPI0020081699|nr:hypothetical protein Pst134EA_011373 [Puccinia striiformis f. sp. tritici]KAH9467745.1 hypothetical protein Pst134EA_011373 [Puccinia striiformis f. sp. tritici]